jgi:hemolysin III
MTIAEGERLIIEEIANSVTHGVGLALSIAGFAVLVFLAAVNGDASHIAGCSVFGATLVLLYAASTLYHSFRKPHLKQVLKIVDHCAIFLLIAGTYTPFTLVNLRGLWGWILFGLVWTLSLVGIVFKLLYVNRFQIISVLLYLMMGWICIIAIKPLVALVPTGGLLWLLAGGLFYSTGVIFFACKRIPFNHTIWHLFVMAGSICHYFAVMFYVLPSRA